MYVDDDNWNDNELAKVISFRITTKFRKKNLNKQKIEFS